MFKLFLFSSLFVLSLAQKSDDFGLNLVQSLQQNDDQNVVLSPIGLTKSVILLLSGSQGKTREELLHLIDIKSEDELKSVQSAEERIVENLLNKNGDDFEFTLLTRLLVSKRGVQSLKEAFKRAVREELKSDVTEVDFENESKEVTREVNEWLNNATRGRQNRFFKDSLDEKSSMVLLSAVDVKVKPQNNFSQSEERKEFKNFVSYNLPLMSQMVPFLQSRGLFRVKTNEELNSELLEIPFEKNVSLVIAQPKSLESLQYLNENLTSVQLNAAFDDLMKATPTLTRLFLPKFKIDFDFEMKEVFEEVFDVKTLFTSADFSDAFRSSDGTSGQRLTTSLHKTTFEMKENAKPIQSESVAPSNEFWVKKPFLFALRDNSQSIMILLGKVNHLVDEEALGLGFI